MPSHPTQQPDLFGSNQQTESNREPTALTVTTLHREMKRALSTLGNVAVTGEVHDVKRYPTVTFLMLKERASQVAVTVTSGKARFCHFKNGDTVVVTGMIDTNQGTGRLSLLANSIVPTGEGAVAALIDQTRERLRTDGLLDRERRALPKLPALVVVVCGNDAAVKHDFQTIADQRFRGYPIHYVTASQSSAESLLSGLEQAQRVPGVEVIVLARGGGDGTQLLPYSDEILCRAIAASRVPVVTAIGHETNSPVCDEVSDRRAPTPTAAATMVIPDRERLVSQLEQWQQLRTRTITDSVKSETTRLQHRWVVLAGAPMRRVETHRAQLAGIGWDNAIEFKLIDARACVGALRPDKHLTERVQACAYRVASSKVRIQPPPTIEYRHQLVAIHARINSLSPQRVLERGFAVVRSGDGTVVRDPAQVRAGDEIVIALAGGNVRAIVSSTEPLNQEDIS
jgi:exodeoxyribonuclease VII large subunit